MLGAVVARGRKVRRIVLLAMVFGIPVVFLRVLNDPINIPKLSFLLLGVGFVAAARVVELALGAPARGLLRLTIPVIALGGSLSMAWVASPYKEWSLWGNYPRLLGLVPYLATILFGVLLADAFDEGPRPIAWALLGGGGLVGSYALVQALGVDPFTWSVKGAAAERVVTSSLGNGNFLGGYLAIVLPVGAALAYCEQGHRRLAVTLLALGAGGWLVAQSAGGWAAGIAGSAIWLGLATAPRWRPAKIVGYAVAVLLAIAAVGSILWTVVDRAGAPLPATVARRGDWWQGAARMTADSPFVGRGPSVYALEGTMFRTEEDGRQVGFDYTDDPHSIVLAFTTSAGVIGAIGLAFAFGSLLWRGARIRSDDLLRAGFFGGLVAYIIQALISIDTVSLRVAFWSVAAGLVVPAAQTTKRARRRTARGVPRRRPSSSTGLKPLAGVLVAGILGFVVGWGGVRLATSDAHFHHATELFAAGEGNAALREFDSALSFRDEPHYRRIYGRMMGSVAVALAEDGEEAQAQDFFARAEDAFAFTGYLPHANSVVDHARFMLEWARTHPEAYSRALEIYERALALDPNNPALRNEVAAARATPPE